MAGNTPSAVVDQPGASRSRRLWQAPVFVLGVGVLLAVWWTRPLLGGGETGTPARRVLSEVRRLLDRPDGDLAEAARLAEQVLAEKDAHPEAAGEADYLLGTARMRQAARAEGTQAADLWTEARAHLEAAEKETVPEKERVRLQFRLGVAAFHTHGDPEKVIGRIKTSIDQIDQIDDLVEGYNALTQAYLLIPKPDLQEALAANLKLRNLSQASEQALAPARLLGGELELRRGHPDLARRALIAIIGSQARPEIQAKARQLTARSYQDEGRWAEAAVLWQKMLADGRQNGEALYNLGLCAQRQEQNADAIRAWEQCVQIGGDEGRAAALALAELRLKGPSPDSAVEILAKAVDDLKPGEDWSNPLIDRAGVVKLFQDAARIYLDAHQYDTAVHLAKPFERVAAPGEAAVLRARASSEWARACRDEAKQAAPAARPAAEDAARDLFRKAATAYAAASEQSPPTAQPGEYLWLSARCSWEGRDLESASARLEKVLQIQVAEEQQKQDWYVQRQGEAWYLLGEAHRNLKDVDGADTAYRECIKYPTIFAYRARYYLAQADAARGHLDDAREALELNLKLLRKDPDPEAQEKSLFALGGLLFQAGRYLQVVERLGEAIPRFPANPEATRAHFQLAESYRRLADQANLSESLMNPGQSQEKLKHSLEEHRRYLTNAAKEFLDLAGLLDTPEGQGLLTPEEQVDVPFLAAGCLFDLGDYADALTAYDALAARYPGRLEGLNALGGMVRCYSALGDTAKMQQRLAEIDALLPKMPQPVRDQWSEWLTVARKPVSMQ